MNLLLPHEKQGMYWLQVGNLNLGPGVLLLGRAAGGTVMITSLCGVAIITLCLIMSLTLGLALAQVSPLQCWHGNSNCM